MSYVFFIKPVWHSQKLEPLRPYKALYNIVWQTLSGLTSGNQDICHINIFKCVKSRILGQFYNFKSSSWGGGPFFCFPISLIFILLLKNYHLRYVMISSSTAHDVLKGLRAISWGLASWVQILDVPQGQVT